MTTKGTTEEIPTAEFPRDIPSDLEQNFIAIVCDRDRMQWSFHERKNHQLSPSVFWTTPHLYKEDVSATPCLTLHRFLCHHALNHFYGGTDIKYATKQKASQVAAKRKVPSTTIYVLSKSPDHEKNILQLFQDVSVRLFRLRRSHFFASEQIGDISESMIPVGMYASLLAARKDHDTPVLLLKCGNAITYMGMNKDSKFLGGGACPSMSIRCRSLFDYCSKDFPTIDFHQYKKITDKAKLDKKPMPLFASNMEVGIAANATAELAGQLRNIVKQFLKLVGPSDNPATVVVTDDDNGILMELLKENCSGMIEIEPDVVFPSSSKVTFASRKNMPPYGIQYLLRRNREKRLPLNPDEEIREKFVGLRVAKKRKKEVFRGSISRVVPGEKMEEDTFVVLLEDGEEVFLDLVQIYDAMVLYHEVGEETKEKNKEDWVGEKREASTEVQVNLEGSNDAIKKHMVELNAAKEKERSIDESPEEESRPKKRQKSAPTKKKADPKKYIGQRIAKFFDDPTPSDPDHQIVYFGAIDSYSATKKLWHITYDDDDQEEFEFDEVRQSILLYAKNKDDDCNASFG